MAEGSNIIPRSAELLTDRENESFSPAISGLEGQSARQSQGLKESLSVTLLRKEHEIRNFQAKEMGELRRSCQGSNTPNQPLKLFQTMTTEYQAVQQKEKHLEIDIQSRDHHASRKYLSSHHRLSEKSRGSHIGNPGGITNTTHTNFSPVNDSFSPGSRTKKNLTTLRVTHQPPNFTGFGVRQTAIAAVTSTPGFLRSPNKNSSKIAKLTQEKSSTSVAKKPQLRPSGHSSVSVNTNANTHRNIKTKQQSTDIAHLMNDTSQQSIDYMRFPNSQPKKLLNTKKKQQQVVSTTLDLAQQTAKLLSSQQTLNIMSGGDLNKLVGEQKETQLPIISINTGGNRFSYPLMDESNQTPPKFKGASPYQQQEEEDQVEEFMPMDIFQRVIQETEILIHNNLDEPSEQMSMQNLQFHNKRIIRPIQKRNFKIYTGPQTYYESAVTSPHTKDMQQVEKYGDRNYSTLKNPYQSTTQASDIHSNTPQVALKQHKTFLKLSKKTRQNYQYTHQQTQPYKTAFHGGGTYHDSQASQFLLSPVSHDPQATSSLPITPGGTDCPPNPSSPTNVPQMPSITQAAAEDRTSPQFTTQKGFIFKSSLPPDNYNQRAKALKAHGNLGMKKNLKLIKKDRDHKQIEERFQKIYEKLKINLEPIQESQLSKFKEYANQVNSTLADTSIMDTDLNTVSLANSTIVQNPHRNVQLASKMRGKAEFSPPNRIYGNNSEIKGSHPLKEVLVKARTREVKPFAPIHINKMHNQTESQTMVNSFASIQTNEKTIRLLPPILPPVKQEFASGEDSSTSKDNETPGPTNIVKCKIFKKHVKKVSVVSKPSQAPIQKKSSPVRIQQNGSDSSLNRVHDKSSNDLNLDLSRLTTNFMIGNDLGEDQPMMLTHYGQFERQGTNLEKQRTSNRSSRNSINDQKRNSMLNNLSSSRNQVNGTKRPLNQPRQSSNQAVLPLQINADLMSFQTGSATTSSKQAVFTRTQDHVYLFNNQSGVRDLSSSLGGTSTKHNSNLYNNV